MKNPEPKHPDIAIDGKATAELLGALVRGFFFGDENAVPQPQPQPQPQRSGVRIEPDMQRVPNEAIPTVEPPLLPSALEAAQTTYGVISRRMSSFFSGHEIQWEAVQSAFNSHNMAGLSVAEALLVVAVLRAMMIRVYGVPAATVDYTLDKALEVVDVLCADEPMQG